MELKNSLTQASKPSGLSLTLDHGLKTELKVIKDLKLKNCEILGHRIKTPFAEVDVLFRSSKSKVILLEVKSLSKWVWIESRLTKKQSERLKRAAIYFENRLGESVQICVAYVIRDKIFYLELEA